MTPKDRPANRSLEGRGESGDRARPPEELLDNLRLRLSQLAENHPSAPRDRERERGRDRERASQADAAADYHDDEVTGAGSAAGGSSGDLKSAVDLAWTDDSGDGGIGPMALTRAAGWAGDAVMAAASGLGELATMDLPGRGASGDPYRPWFMAGEPGAPWWASGPS